MKLVEHYIMRGTRRLVLIIVGFLIFIFASYSAQRYLTEAANGTLALDVVLDIVFYKVLIALEMLLPVGLYVSVGVTLGQMYTDSEITAISAAGGSPGRLYKAVLYLAIPLSIFVTLLSMYGRPWAYAQIYQLEQQSQSELDVRQLRAKKFNTNDNGRMILSQTVDQDNNRLTDALIYTSTANRTRIFRARSVDVVDPSPEKPTVMLHNGTAYLLDHQGRDDNEQIYRNLQLHLNPLDQSPNVKRKAKSVTELARSVFPADHAELQWRQSRGLTALLMALLAISLSRVKPRQGRFSTLLPLTLLFVAIFMAATSAVRWWLTARFPSFWFVVSTRTHANGPADAGRTRLLFAAEIFPMNVFSRYLIRHLFLGFAAAAGLLLPLFTTFNLINELDDVSPGGYRWTQAVLVVLMTLPRTLVELSPFIALLGGIVGFGAVIEKQ